MTSQAVAKSLTGIIGLDEVTGGGLPTERTTLICGGAGCGKSLIGVQFLAYGAKHWGENGVLMSFEESPLEISQNAAAIGIDLDDLISKKMIAIDSVRLERSEIEETGAYDLEGLFVRLDYAIASIKAKRVVLDTVEALFSGLSDETALRSELRRLFRHLKDKGVTTIVTGERGEGSLTRYGLEEYISDCVIFLDHRVNDQLTTRRLRIVKYRGSKHGTNEFPFLIDDDGISVLPITSIALTHTVNEERVSTGIRGLDAILGGKGYFQGSSLLITGTAGTGKTSLAAAMARSVCQEGHSSLYFTFEESPGPLVRNMRSIGLDLQHWIDDGKLQIHATRPTRYGLETHLATMERLIKRLKPKTVIIDPISNFVAAGTYSDAGNMLARLVDLIKSRSVTAILTCLIQETGDGASTAGISSIIDTWIQVNHARDKPEDFELRMVKSRGMSHGKSIHKLQLSDDGILVEERAKA